MNMAEKNRIGWVRLGIRGSVEWVKKRVWKG